MQVQQDPAAIPKLAALYQKLRSVMQPALAHLAATSDEDAQHEIIQYYTGVLQHKLQMALKVSFRTRDCRALPANFERRSPEIRSCKLIGGACCKGFLQHALIGLQLVHGVRPHPAAPEASHLAVLVAGRML